MKELLLQMAKYNLWANKRLIDVMQKLDDEKQNREIPSSFPSIYNTALHIWGAEFLWLQRLQLAEQPIYTPYVFTGTFAEACTQWQEASQAFIDFIDKQFDDKALEHVLQYYNSEKQSFKNPVFEVLQHVFNHSTYHRGQLVTLLRQVGVEKLPATDFTAYLRR
jgi:uncharacterized damage-inducible protein DinB